METIALLIIAASQTYILKKIDRLDERMDEFSKQMERLPRRQQDDTERGKWGL